MWLYEASTCLRPIIALVVCVVCFVYWSRAHRRGFLWIGAAYVLLLMTDLLYLLINLAGPGLRGGGWLVGLLGFTSLSRIVFTILILIGLCSFYTESRDSNGNRRARSVPWHVVSLVFRRAFFIGTGSIFVFVGPVVALSNRTMVGVGCVTALMGLACLWLGLHPGSPLVKTATRNEEPMGGHGQTMDTQEGWESTDPPSGAELGADPMEEIS